MPSEAFRLLYDIEVLGIDALDAVSKKTSQVSLDTKYSEAAFSKLERQINKLVVSGESYRSALDRISAAQRKFGAESADLAKDILKNDEARRRSMAETTKAAEREAQAQQRSANLAFQTNQRIWREQERERLRLERESLHGSTEKQRVALHGLRTASVLSGIRDSRSIDAFFGSFGGSAAIAGVGGALALGATVNLVRNAAERAQEMQRLADELGITAQQAYKLQAAANLTGQNLNVMGMAARKLAEAIEDPGSAGKKTAEALTKAGISINQGMGQALQSVMNKLAGIEDPAKRADLAIAVFGREGAGIAEVAANLKNVGQVIDNDVQKRLVDANRQIKEFTHNLVVLEGKAASAFLAANSFIENTSGVLSPVFDKERIAPMLKQDASAALAKVRPTAPSFPLTDYSKLDAALQSKESLDDRLEKARIAYEGERRRADNIKATGADQATVDAEAKKVNDLRSAYEKLEAAKKAANRDPNTIPDLIANYRGQVNVGQAERDPVAMAQERLRRQIQEAQKEGASKNQLDQIRSIGVDDYFHALKQRKDQQNEFFSKIDQAAQQQYIKDVGQMTSAAFSGTDRAMQAVMYPNFNAQTITAAKLKAEQDAKDRQFQRLQLQFEGGTIDRQFGQLANQRRASGTDTAEQTYRDRLAMAQRMYDLQVKQASLEEDADRRALDMQRAKYDYIAAQDAARIERENQIAEITRRQKEETRGFVTGLFSAATSGQPNATSNFFRGFERNIIGQIVGNIGEDTLGTLNSKLTLQRDSGKPGILGRDAEHPNWFGKALRGTFLGFDPAGNKTDALKTGLESVTTKFTPLVTANDHLRTAMEANRVAVVDLTQVMAKSFGLDTTGLPGMSSAGSVAATGTSDKASQLLTETSTAILGPLQTMMNSGKNLDPSGIFARLEKVVGGPGGTSGFAGRVTLPKPEYTESLGTVPPHILAEAKRITTNTHVDQAPAPRAETKRPQQNDSIYRTIQFGVDGGPMPKGGYIGREVPGTARPVVPQQSIRPESIEDSIRAVIRRHPIDARNQQDKGLPRPTDTGSAPAKQSSKPEWPSITLGPPVTKNVDKETGKTAWPTIELPAYKSPSSNGKNVSEPVMAEIPPDALNWPGDVSSILNRLSSSLSYGVPTLPSSGRSAEPSIPSPPPIDASSEYAPDDVLRSLGTSLGSIPATPPPFQMNSVDRGMEDVLASINRGDIGRASNIERKQQDPELSTATGIANTLSKILRGAKYTESGHGLAGVLTGGMDLGNGVGVALDKKQRLGLGLGMGAQVAGGAYEAVQGFGKGGARGDVQGVAGTMAAIAPFAGPAAPFLEAGAAITGLISSLFPDPRQERIRQMQRNLEHSAYLTPAARDYNYANGGGGSGVSTGDGNSLRAGGPNANYSFNVSAIDAGTFLDHARQNSEAWSQTMLLAMSSADSAAVQSLVSWNANNGGSVSNVWANSGH